jgi:hypothetical protein
MEVISFEPPCPALNRREKPLKQDREGLVKTKAAQPQLKGSIARKRLKINRSARSEASV